MKTSTYFQDLYIAVNIYILKENYAITTKKLKKYNLDRGVTKDVNIM